MVGLSLVDEWKHAGLTSRVTAVHRNRSVCRTRTNVSTVGQSSDERRTGLKENERLTPVLTADPGAEAGTDHLFGPLGLDPALADEVRQSCVHAAGSLRGGLRHTDRLVDGGLDVGDHTGTSA